MVDFNEFKNLIAQLSGIIKSKTRTASYTDFQLVEDILYFKRVNPKTNWDLDIKELFQIYSTNKFINTSVIKRVTGGRVNSPSVAILMAIKCIDEKGNRL